MSELSHKNIESTESVTTTSGNNIGDFKSTSENDNPLGGSLSTSISSLASSSGGSVKSGIPKPVSIKYATNSDSLLTTPSTSRIDRLCGNQHKPSLLSSPIQSSKFIFSFKITKEMCHFEMHIGAGKCIN